MASTPPTQGQELYDDARQDANPHLGHKRPALSQEEIAILRECNRESFWYRCVPFSVAFVGGATYLTHAGILKANPRYGLLFKNMGACLLGYIAGKLSYQGVCKQKLLERAPNSTLARTIRGERVPVPESGNIQFYPPEAERDGGRARFRNTDVGEAHPSYKELDDTQRPSVDREIKFSDMKTADQSSESSSMSYDDIRKKHRAEYEARMATSPKNPMRQPPFPPPKGGPYQEAEPTPEPSRPPPSGPSPRRNQYGDAIE